MFHNVLAASKIFGKISYQYSLNEKVLANSAHCYQGALSFSPAPDVHDSFMDSIVDNRHITLKARVFAATCIMQIKKRFFKVWKIKVYLFLFYISILFYFNIHCFLVLLILKHQI